MAKKPFGFIALLLTLGLWVIAGCTPGAVPKATQAPVISRARAFTPPAMTATKRSTEDEAWDKVVAAAKNEGTVTVYSLSYTGDIGLDLAEAFYKRYGIKAQIIAGGGAELTERIRTEGRTKFAGIQLLKVWMTENEYQEEIGNKFRDGVAAKLLGLR